MVRWDCWNAFDGYFYTIFASNWRRLWFIHTQKMLKNDDGFEEISFDGLYKFQLIEIAFNNLFCLICYKSLIKIKWLFSNLKIIKFEWILVIE